ncbi:MAG: DUF5777 family beta-barrel protein [Bacteroidia bacterium]
MKKLTTLVILIACMFTAKAQDDLLSLISDSTPQKEYITNGFKSTRVINGQSIELLGAGVLDFRISHRFGRLNGGSYQLYGLDQATIRLGLDYGISKRLMVGIGRSSSKKEVDGFLKYRLLWQSTGPRSVPFSLILVSGITVNGLKFEDETRTNYFSSRLAFVNQLIIGRKFSERLTLQLSPTLIHRNIVTETVNRHDVVALGTQGRIKLSKRIAFMLEYFYVFPGSMQDIDYTNSLSIGFDIETGGHVFQLHFTNALGMNERAFITETDGSWGKGDIQFGFNISRVFTIVNHSKNKK